MPRGEQVNQVALELVRVLIFVHEDELEAALVMFAHVGVLLQQLEPEREQVVEIHRVGRAFAGDVTLLHVGDLAGELEITELLLPAFPRWSCACWPRAKKFRSSTSGFGKCVPFLVSMPASAMQALIKSFASSRSRIVKSRW
jgi:hypothetical protein